MREQSGQNCSESKIAAVCGRKRFVHIRLRNAFGSCLKVSLKLASANWGVPGDGLLPVAFVPSAEVRGGVDSSSGLTMYARSGCACWMDRTLSSQGQRVEPGGMSSRSRRRQSCGRCGGPLRSKSWVVDGWHLGGCFWHRSAIPTIKIHALFSYVSSSGGGLPGRPATRESRGARLIFAVK